MEIILDILNHPLTWISVIAIPTTIIFKHWFKSKLEVFKAKNNSDNKNKMKLESIAGKIQFAVENTDLAYQKLTKDINEATKNLARTQDPNARKVFENKIKSAKSQLGYVQKIMEHKDVIDLISPVGIPAIEKGEKWIMKMVKGGFGV